MDRKQQFAEKIFCNYSQWIFNKALKLTNSENDGEDILQDCMVKVITNYETLCELKPYRLREYLTRYIESSAKKYRKNYDFFAENFPIPYCEIKIENKVLFEQITSIIRTLNPRERKIIEMKYFYRMSDCNIAHIIGIKKSCVRMTVHRIIIKIRKEIL